MVSEAVAVLVILNLLLWVSFLVYTFTGLSLLTYKLVLGSPAPWRWLHTWWSFTKGPALVYVITSPWFQLLWLSLLGQHFDITDYLAFCLQPVVWWMLRKAGDDDWKRRADKLKAVVKQLGNKLVIIVPKAA